MNEELTNDFRESKAFAVFTNRVFQAIKARPRSATYRNLTGKDAPFYNYRQWFLEAVDSLKADGKIYETQKGMVTYFRVGGTEIKAEERRGRTNTTLFPKKERIVYPSPESFPERI